MSKHSSPAGKRTKRFLSIGGKRELEEEDEEDPQGSISPEFALREIKRMKHDSSLLSFFQENHTANLDGGSHMDHLESKEGETVSIISLMYAVPLPDNLKVADLIDSIQKKLELPVEMCAAALEKLHKNGYVIISGLKTLKKEGWERLELPLALEEELKQQISMTKGKSLG